MALDTPVAPEAMPFFSSKTILPAPRLASWNAADAP
jgi:hypothetical protein